MPEVVPVDQRGHSFTRDSLDLSIYRLLTAGKEDYGQAFLDGTLLMSLEMRYECNWCGQRPKVTLEENETVVRADSDCTAIDGVRIEFDLHVPSGRIVIDDDLRPTYDVDMDEITYSYNTVIGQAEYCGKMAMIGCAYGPVGNTSPTLYRTGPGTYVIANPIWSDDEGYEREDPHSEIGEPLASVCTDLWAYSIADYDDYLSKGGTPEAEMGWTRKVVDVDPGTYHFVHHTGERTFDRDAIGVPIIYADIAWTSS